MRITRSGTTPTGRPQWLDEEFTIALTGEELVRLWLLSYTGEGGDTFPHGTQSQPRDPKTGHERFSLVIERALGSRSIGLCDLIDQMHRGKIG